MHFEAGPVGVLVFVLLAAMWSLAFAGFGYAIALKTGNPAAVQSAFLLFFPFLGLVIYLPFYVFGTSNAGLPVVDRLFPRRHTILILRGLAVVIEAGRTGTPSPRLDYDMPP